MCFDSPHALAQVESELEEFGVLHFHQQCSYWRGSGAGAGCWGCHPACVWGVLTPLTLVVIQFLLHTACCVTICETFEQSSRQGGEQP
eukprot:scaffold296594_cov70-Attheya_sp.AAC.4